VLLLQVLGAVAAGVVVSILISRRRHATGVHAAVALLATAVAFVLIWPNGWSEGRDLVDKRGDDGRLSAGEAAVAGGSVLHVNTGFVEWVREQLRPGETFHLFLPGPKDPAGDGVIQQWTTYRLLPNLAVDSPEQADVLVFYNEPPARYDRGAFEPARGYGPGFGLARRR
jgi:hypothetical protein